MSLEASVVVERGGFRLECALEASASETVVLVGPNGSGKSTLVEALAGLIPISAGRVALDGRLLEDPLARVRVPPEKRNVGVLFQGLHLFPHMSAEDNAAYGLTARGMRRRAARRAVAPLLERLGLSEQARRLPGALSGGEAQRVALARALAPRPRLLLLDEPLSAADVERRPRVGALLRELLAEFEGPRLVITHDPGEASMLAGNLVVLEQGRVVQSGSVEALRSAPRSPYVASVVATPGG